MLLSIQDPVREHTKVEHDVINWFYLQCDDDADMEYLETQPDGSSPV